MNKIWIIIIIFSAIYGILYGDIETLVSELLNVPQKTISLIMMVGGLMIFWNGMFNIAIKSGLINNMSRLFKPLTKAIFSDLPKDHIVHEYICANISANILGLGNAATPMGIKALHEMKKLNNNQPIATKSMITFVILNTSSLTIFPSTLFGIRHIYKSQLNMQLLPFIILSTLIATCSALLIDRLFYLASRRKNNE